MGSDLAVRDGNAAALGTRQQFDRDQLDIIKNTICKGVSDNEFQLFVQVAQRTGLDPFVHQIHAVSRWDKQVNSKVMTIQVGIDGFRLIAERTGKYRGQIGPQWCGKDEVWKDVWLQDTAPEAARVAVLRSDFDQPLWGLARRKSYEQDSPLWKRMPELMLAIAAERLALRKAFPHELSGLYGEEELGAEDKAEPTEPPVGKVKLGKPADPAALRPANVTADGEVIEGAVADPPPPAEPVQPAPIPPLPADMVAEYRALTEEAMRLGAAKRPAPLNPVKGLEWATNRLNKLRAAVEEMRRQDAEAASAFEQPEPVAEPEPEPAPAAAMPEDIPATDDDDPFAE